MHLRLFIKRKRSDYFDACICFCFSLLSLSLCLSCSSSPWQYLRGGLPLSPLWPVSFLLLPLPLAFLLPSSLALLLFLCHTVCRTPSFSSSLSPGALFSTTSFPVAFVSSRLPYFLYICILFYFSLLLLLLLLSLSLPHLHGSSPHYITVLPSSLPPSLRMQIHSPALEPVSMATQSEWILQPGFPPNEDIPLLFLCVCVCVCAAWVN